MFSVLLSWPGDGLQNGLDGVELPGGEPDHQVVGVVVGEGQPAAVKAVERNDGG
jgi:hypothetical protein